MITHHQFRSPFVTTIALAAILGLAACSDSANQVQAQANRAQAQDRAETTPAIDYTGATAERVLKRSEQRWALIVEAAKSQERWVEVYDFLTPSMQEGFPITVYLPTKVKFHYDEPTSPKLLKLEEDRAFLQVSATWLAYLNPDVRKAAGGETLVKPFQSIEEWHWVEGDWYLERPHRESDFYRDNPDFFGKPDNSTKNDEPK